MCKLKQLKGARHEANGKLLLKIKLVSQLVALAIARNYRKRKEKFLLEYL